MGKVQLIMRNAKYDKIGNFPDETWFSKDFTKTKVIDRKNFKSFVEMADWLDNKCKKKCKNRVMFAKTGNRNIILRKVVFDGTNTWVENYGNI